FSGPGGWGPNGLAAFSKAFHVGALWAVVQPSALPVPEAQNLCAPWGRALAWSAPGFSAARVRNGVRGEAQSSLLALHAKRSVETTRSTPTSARTGRSFRGYGESVLFSMSDPRGKLGPRLPRPVEVRVRPAEERPDHRQHEHRGDEDEEDQVLAPAL